MTNAPGLTASKLAGVKVQLTLTDQANLLYVFEASTNLVQRTKVALRTNLTSVVDLIVEAATNCPQRFYRLRWP